VARRTRVWMVLVPVAVPIGFLLRGQITHDHPNTALMALSALALLALAGVRAASLLRAVEAAKRAVQEREHRFRALAANAADVVVVVDPSGRVKQGAADLGDLLGVDPAVLEQTPAVETPLLVDPEAMRRLLVRSVSAPGVVFQEEVEVTPPNGCRRWVDVRLSNMIDDPVVDGIVVNVHDITDRKRTEDELRHSALHDPLTGLANRALLRDRIEQALRRGPRPGTAPALLHLDLDGFKSVNDRFGREAGDQLLQAVAQRLDLTTRSEDTIARIGADELAVFIEDNHAGPGEAVTTADRILQALDVPITIAGIELTASASIGVAVMDLGTTAGELLRRADIALHRAKADGPAHVVVYDEAMGSAAGEALLLTSELAQAAERGELVLHYQPLVDLPSGRVVAFESLVRWAHPRLGLVAPDRFIPLAEESGLIVPIGRWVLETACRTVAGWRHPDGRPVRTTVGVNLSARQLASDGIVDDVRSALAISGLDPRRFVVELTETALVADPVAAAGRLHALSELGVRIAIDDFGTGY
jgi:diguanylate cyclase (GGDEF)-like protein/PAS domain S-box-containing protein